MFTVDLLAALTGGSPPSAGDNTGNSGSGGLTDLLSGLVGDGGSADTGSQSGGGDQPKSCKGTDTGAAPQDIDVSKWVGAFLTSRFPF